MTISLQNRRKPQTPNLQPIARWIHTIDGWSCPLPAIYTVCLLVQVHLIIDGFHSIFSLWQLEGITSPRCLLIASHDLLPSSFYGERCYRIHLCNYGLIIIDHFSIDSIWNYLVLIQSLRLLFYMRTKFGRRPGILVSQFHGRSTSQTNRFPLLFK